MLRVHNTHRKVSADPTAGNRIPGTPDRLQQYGTTPPPSEDKTNSSGVLTNNEDEGVHLCPDASTAVKEDEFDSICNFASPTLLLTPTDGTLQHTGEEHERLRGSSEPTINLPGGTALVGHPDVQV